LRVKRGGPSHIKCGRRVLYEAKSFENWLEAIGGRTRPRMQSSDEGFVDQAGRPISAAIVRTFLRLRVLVEDASDVLFGGLASQILRLNQLLMSGSKGSESR
jgi:hypothetical protein